MEPKKQDVKKERRWGGGVIVHASLDRLTLVCHPNEGFIVIIINSFTMLGPSLVTQPPPFLSAVLRYVPLSFRGPDGSS